MDHPQDASNISKISVSDSSEEPTGAVCALGDETDLMMRLELHHEDAKIRRVVGAFTMAMIGSIAGPRFNGAYFFVSDSEGNELPDQSLENSPLMIGIRSMGVQNPDTELLDQVSANLTNMLQYVISNAGLDGDVEIVRSNA